MSKTICFIRTPLYPHQQEEVVVVLLMLPLKLLYIQVHQVDQVEEVQHPHHRQDLDPEVLETHLL